MAQENTGGNEAKSDLLPVFMPPLATLLASREVSKGSRLTEAEALSIRDKAACIMMDREDAEKMDDSRGFRDVEPENCWADWHRLRVQMTGNGYLPKLILCLPCDVEAGSRCGYLLDSEGIEHEWSEHDDQIMTAFQASACRSDPSFTENDFVSLGEHSRVLYVLSPNFSAEDGVSVSLGFLRLGRRLLEAGALGLKCESSGIAHGRARWLELASEAEGVDSWSALFRAYVQLPIQGGDDLHTCGLHLLGQPDLIVSITLLSRAYGSIEVQARTAVELFRAFAGYLLGECTPGRFASGHTFSITSESPRFRVLWEECTGYEEDDFFFNPFGRWRFAELLI